MTDQQLKSHFLLENTKNVPDCLSRLSAINIDHVWREDAAQFQTAWLLNRPQPQSELKLLKLQTVVYISFFTPYTKYG